MTNSLIQTAASPEEYTSSEPEAPRRRGRIKRSVGIAVLALVAAAAGGYAWLGATSEIHDVGEAECTDLTVSEDARHSDHAAVCGVLASLVDAWNDNDAKAYGQLFTGTRRTPLSSVATTRAARTSPPATRRSSPGS